MKKIQLEVKDKVLDPYRLHNEIKIMLVRFLIQELKITLHQAQLVLLPVIAQYVTMQLDEGTFK